MYPLIFEQANRISSLGNFIHLKNSQQQQIWHQICRFKMDAKFQSIFLYSPKANGLTHLLTSLAEYLNLKLMAADNLQDAQIIDKNDANGLIIDDIDQLLTEQNNHTQNQLIYAYEHCLANDKLIIFASHCPITALKNCMQDLMTRLMASVFIKLPKLSAEQMKAIVLERAKLRGIYTIDDQLYRYLCFRSTRNIKTLIDYLDKIDIISHQHNQKIKLKHFKAILNNEQ